MGHEIVGAFIVKGNESKPVTESTEDRFVEQARSLIYRCGGVGFRKSCATVLPGAATSKPGLKGRINCRRCAR